MVALTPNIHMALTLRSTFFSMVNLFAGFVMPKQVTPYLWLFFYIQPKSKVYIMEPVVLETYCINNQEICQVELSQNVVALHGNEKNVMFSAENPKMVDMDVLPEPYIVGVGRITEFAVWRCRERDNSIWREEECFSFLGGLLRLQT